MQVVLHSKNIPNQVEGLEEESQEVTLSQFIKEKSLQAIILLSNKTMRSNLNPSFYLMRTKHISRITFSRS